jgi:hypothetical protein
MNPTMLRSVFAATCASALLPASPCHATFEWLRIVIYDCNPPGLEDYQVLRIYAEFNDPGDRLSSVFGSPSNPASIAYGGGFFQHPLGGNTAPGAEVIAKEPLVEWDTFCTIGLAQNIDEADQTVTSPGFPSLPVKNQTNMSWSIPTASIDQGAPDASGRVLILQLTVPDGGWFEQFNLALTYRPAGSQGFVTVNNLDPILLPVSSGDIDSNLEIDIEDLLLVLNSWGQTGPGIADPTDDGFVNIDDLLLVLTRWGGWPHYLCGS